MRTALPLLFALLLAACASTTPREPELPAEEEAAMEATADSLLALPPGQLSEADAIWVEAYQARRAEEARRGASAGGTRVYVSACGVVGLLVLLLSR